MTYNDGFDRTVSEWLTDQAGHSKPDYLDEVLSRTTRTRQRPAWSSLERWLPVLSTARFAPVPRLAWLLAVIGLILALAATAVFIGSRTKPLPPPFGMAGQESILFGSRDGDIYVLDPATNESRPLVSGAATDSAPMFSPDGTKFVFNRQETQLQPSTTMVANADGTNARPLGDATTGLGFVWKAWSPDSTRLAVVGPTLNTAPTGVESTGLRIVGPGVQPFLVVLQRYDLHEITYPMWRPDGREIVFMANVLDRDLPFGLFAIHTDGSRLRAIVDPVVRGPGDPALSPDGTEVAYSVWNGERNELHVVNVDTGHDATVAFTGSGSDRRPQWSADGRRLLFERYKGDTYHLAVGSVDGGAVVEIGPARPANTGGSEARFSPDGTKVIAFYQSDGSSWILDPSDGSEVRLDEGITSPLSWPRAAP